MSRAVHAGRSPTAAALLLRSRAKQAGAFNPQTSRLLKTLINTALKTAAPTALFSVVGAGVSLAFAESDLYTTDVPFAFFRAYTLGDAPPSPRDLGLTSFPRAISAHIKLLLPLPPHNT